MSFMQTLIVDLTGKEIDFESLLFIDKDDKK